MVDYFDRAWSIVCRDSVRPVGAIYALRGDSAAIATRLATLRAATVACRPGEQSAVEDLGAVPTLDCRMTEGNLGYRVMTLKRGRVTWVAEGLAAYQSALAIGLRTVIADRIVPGRVEVVASATDDPVAFARVQAGTLEPEQALAEGYRRNNSGDYAEAAEFFDTLQQRVTGVGARERQAEYLINRALQKSNLGDFAEADSLFAESRRYPFSERVLIRLRRNYEAIHLLNQRQYGAALARLDEAVAPIVRPPRQPGSAIEIGAQVAAEINQGLPVNQRLAVTESAALTDEERSELLDAQALQLRAAVMRLSGNAAGTAPLLDKALASVVLVREGRVTSAIRLRSEILAESGLSLEALGTPSGAEAKLREAVGVLEAQYPQSSAVNGARTRLAAFLVRAGQKQAALGEYRQVVSALTQTRSQATGLANQLAPYFDVLVADMPTNPALADEMFLTAQLLIRPGIADTQAVLARGLSEGNAEASRLYRQARALERDTARNRIALAELTSLDNRTADVKNAIDALNRDIATLETQQTETQAKLTEFSQFRAIAPRALPLPELRAVLKPGEAYLKLLAAGGAIYAFYTDGDGSAGYKLAMTPAQLETAVDALRDAIALDVNGQTITQPFDVAKAHDLFTVLAGPVAERLTRARSIVFEPDGALLRLPINLLVTDTASVAAYSARASKPDADAFDFTGMAWLGRDRAISTEVSARALADARRLRSSQGTRPYLGFGENTPVQTLQPSGKSKDGTKLDCSWPIETWAHPISPQELSDVGKLVGAGTGDIVTRNTFTDSAIRSRTDLADYRILHFATHGLVSAPRAGCPARPALLTSFGEGNSDGLLSFGEIFDLKIDADLVILSACNTASTASVTTTREAGVESGGGNALDGLVRAFIGAGGRTVMASHWPAPDDYGATSRLMTGLFRAPAGKGIAEALAAAQIPLMDSADTSHPYYWSGFAVVGDGSQPLTVASPGASQ